MKPGATVIPVASMTTHAVAGDVSATTLTVSPTTARSVRRLGAPVPSRRSPPRTSTSNCTRRTPWLVSVFESGFDERAAAQFALLVTGEFRDEFDRPGNLVSRQRCRTVVDQLVDGRRLRVVTRLHDGAH